MTAENKKGLGTVLTIIIVLAIIAVLGFWFFNQQKTPTVIVGTGEDAQLSEQQIQDLIRAVRRHIVLPEDEEPLVATIVNIDQLVAEQPFYQGASNGDILMIYGSVAKALIYDPRADRLVNVGPVEIQPGTELPPETVPAEGSGDLNVNIEAESEAELEA